MRARYRDPLLGASFDLQSRLYNLVAQDLLVHYGAGKDESSRTYAVDNTLYVLAEYLGWVEIIRREIQFLDLGEQAANERWVDALNAVRDVFASHRMDPVLHVFRGDQRAIGEVMTVPVTEPGAARRSDCLGYAAFVGHRGDAGFSRWLNRLEHDVELLAREPEAHLERVVALQRALVDVMDILDAGCTRYPASLRTKLEPASP